MNCHFFLKYYFNLGLEVTSFNTAFNIFPNEIELKKYDKINFKQYRLRLSGLSSQLIF